MNNRLEKNLAATLAASVTASPEVLAAQREALDKVMSALGWSRSVFPSYASGMSLLQSKDDPSNVAAFVLVKPEGLCYVQWLPQVVEGTPVHYGTTHRTPFDDDQVN